MNTNLPVPPNVWSAIRDAGNFKKLTTFPENWTRYRKTLRKKLWDLMGVKYDKSLALDLKFINRFTHLFKCFFIFLSHAVERKFNIKC